MRIQNMRFKNKAGEHALKYDIVCMFDGCGNPMLFALNLFDPGLSDDHFSYANGFEEFDIGRSQNHIGVVDGDHGGIIGQAEDKSTMNQAAAIRGHIRRGHQFYAAVPLLDLYRMAAQAVVYGLVGQYFH